MTIQYCVTKFTVCVTIGDTTGVTFSYDNTILCDNIYCLRDYRANTTRVTFSDDNTILCDHVFCLRDYRESTTGVTVERSMSTTPGVSHIYRYYNVVDYTYTQGSQAYDYELNKAQVRLFELHILKNSFHKYCVCVFIGCRETSQPRCLWEILCIYLRNGMIIWWWWWLMMLMMMMTTTTT